MSKFQFCVIPALDLSYTMQCDADKESKHIVGEERMLLHVIHKAVTRTTLSKLHGCLVSFCVSVKL